MKQEDMDQDVITDLKQFIAGAITQQATDIIRDIAQLGKRVNTLAERVDGLTERVEKLEIKVDDGFLGIAEILEDMNTHRSTVATHIQDHGNRIVRLEARAA